MIQTRENNLNFLRFLAASFVVFSHGQAVVGSQITKIFGEPLSQFSVMTFFIISGYLITDSWERTHSTASYVINRCLRIFPALAIVTILSAMLLGPLLTNLSLNSYFTDFGFYNYFKNAALYAVYPLPGVFIDNHIPYAVNGSLWSLAPEFFCYILVALVGLSSRATARPYVYAVLFVLSAGVVLYFLISNAPPVVIYAADLKSGAAVIAFFMAAAVCRYFGVKPTLQIAIPMLAIYLALSAVLPTHLLTILKWVCVTYIVLAVGLTPLPIVKNWGKRGDYSYGIYLYAFPVQQAIYQLTAGDIPAGSMIALSFVLSVLCGAASWHLVEKQFLKLKPKRKIARYDPIQAAAEPA